MRKKQNNLRTTAIDEYEIDYVYHEGEAQTYDHPGYGPTVELEHVWAELQDRDGKPFTVDVLPFICETDNEYFETIEYKILEDERDTL